LGQASRCLCHTRRVGRPKHGKSTTKLGADRLTHSLYLRDPDGNGVELVYDLPNEVWEGDVNAALNYFDNIVTVGDEALQDSTNYRVFTPSD
jgi:catechol-2,3-dioxygenase